MTTEYQRAMNQIPGVGLPLGLLPLPADVRELPDGTRYRIDARGNWHRLTPKRSKRTRGR